jgi:hypothetical protein
MIPLLLFFISSTIWKAKKRVSRIVASLHTWRAHKKSDLMKYNEISLKLNRHDAILMKFIRIASSRCNYNEMTLELHSRDAVLMKFNDIVDFFSEVENMGHNAAGQSFYSGHNNLNRYILGENYFSPEINDIYNSQCFEGG